MELKVLLLCLACSVRSFRVTIPNRVVAPAGRLRMVISDTDVSSPFAIGTTVRVIAEDLVLWHSPKYKEGINPHGLVGNVTRCATVCRDGSETPVSANYPVVVKFTTPRLMAHFRPQELEVVSEENVDN